MPGRATATVRWSRVEALEVVERVEDAEFLLLAGVEDDARLEDFRLHLEAAAGRGLPMVCANPDIVAVLP